MFHDKMNHVAAFAATETFANSFGGGDTERGRLVIMERAQADIIHTPFAKRDEFAHDFFYAGCIHDAVNGNLVNHFRKNSKIWTKVINKMQTSVIFYRLKNNLCSIALKTFLYLCNSSFNIDYD